jgi:hypothetical protein
MSEFEIGKKPFEPKKVVEEEENPLYRFSYSQQVKDELNRSIGNESKIQGMSADIFAQSSTASSTSFVQPVIKGLKHVLRGLIFVLLLFLMYNWNLKFFNFGDFQIINYSEEKCTELNRFDFSAEAWKEEVSSSNMNNLKAKYQSERIPDALKEKVGKLQAILQGKTAKIDPLPEPDSN